MRAFTAAEAPPSLETPPMLSASVTTIPLKARESRRIPVTIPGVREAARVIPLSTPGIAVTAFYAFITAWNEFLYALVFLTRPEAFTLPIGVRLFINQFTQNWGAYYSSTRDLELDENRYTFLGLVFDDECSRFEIIYKRDGTRDRALNEGESIRLQFTLTSIGTFGSGGE